MSEPTRTARNGQIVVIFAVALVAIALSVGLVVDGGMAFLQRRDGQNDADLAALAGTKVIADAWMDPRDSAASRGTVYETIRQQMARSACTTATQCTWTAHLIGPRQSDLGELTAGAGGSVGGSSPAILGVRVDVTRRTRTFFLGLVGQSAWNVSASASAMTAQPSKAPAGQLLPIALHEPIVPFAKGQIYDLTPDKIAPGGFAWVGWSKSRSVGNSTCTPDNPILDLKGGTPVTRASDYSWSQVRRCLENWQGSGATVLIPIYAADSVPPTYRIIRVAAFTIRSVPDSKEGDIQAYFVGTFAFAGVPAAASEPPQPTDSLYFLGLVK